MRRALRSKCVIKQRLLDRRKRFSVQRLLPIVDYSGVVERQLPQTAIKRRWSWALVLTGIDLLLKMRGLFVQHVPFV